jgi:hypothetical protein
VAARLSLDRRMVTTDTRILHVPGLILSVTPAHWVYTSRC